MKYMGSKARIAQQLCDVMRKHCPVYDLHRIEYCFGGANMTEVFQPHYAYDSNPYIVEMWEELQQGWAPKHISRKQYNHIRNNFSEYEDHVIGWAGTACSYSGKWFGGYAGQTQTRIGTVRDYQAEALRSVQKSLPNLKNVAFDHCDLIDKKQFEEECYTTKPTCYYIDPPYKGVTGYKDVFDHDQFYKNCQFLANECQGYVFVSEYHMPAPFELIWSGDLRSSFSISQEGGTPTTSTEKLYMLRPRP